MSQSPLVVYRKLSPNCNKPRNHKIDKITIHHMAGNCSIEACGAIFARPARQCSSNYGIGTDGRVGQYCLEENRSWCSSSPSNDHRAITIEVANCSGAPDWRVSDKAFNSLINLCVDICKRNEIARLNYTGNANGNLTEHRYFSNTLCPGPYLHSRMGRIASLVNARLNSNVSTPKPQPQPTNKALSSTPINKTFILNKDTNLWYVGGQDWGSVKAIKSYAKGTTIEIADMVTSAFGGKYYRTPYSAKNNILNGFNVVDCDEVVTTPPTPPPAPKPEPTPTPTEKRERELDIKGTVDGKNFSGKIKIEE